MAQDDEMPKDESSVSGYAGSSGQYQLAGGQAGGLIPKDIPNQATDALSGMDAIAQHDKKMGW